VEKIISSLKGTFIMEKSEEKLPQNIQHLLMEIGEKMVTFRLYLLTKNTPWEVYNNLSEAGCDLLLVHSERNEKIKIEVKTRQRLYTTGKYPERVQFTVTQNEYDNCDFVIGYLLDQNHFFVIPRDELSPTSSNGKSLYKFVIRLKKDGSVNPAGDEYLNRWDLILNKIN